MTRPSGVGQRGKARDRKQKSGTRCLRSPGLTEPSFCPTQLLFSLPRFSFQAHPGILTRDMAVRGRCCNGDQDRSLQRARAAQDSAHILAGVSWGHLV